MNKSKMFLMKQYTKRKRLISALKLSVSNTLNNYATYVIERKNYLYKCKKNICFHGDIIWNFPILNFTKAIEDYCKL